MNKQAIDEETKIKLMKLINAGTKDRSLLKQGWELGEALGLNMYEFLAGQNISKKLEYTLVEYIFVVESKALGNFGSKEYCEVYRNCKKLFGKKGDWFDAIFIEGASGDNAYENLRLSFNDALIDLFPKEADIKKAMGKFYPSLLNIDAHLFKGAEKQSREILSMIVRAYMYQGFPFCD